MFLNFIESSPKKCNGVNKSDDDDAPSLKKTFEPSERATNNIERCKRPRVSFIHWTLIMLLNTYMFLWAVIWLYICWNLCIIVIRFKHYSAYLSPKVIFV